MTPRSPDLAAQERRDATIAAHLQVLISTPEWDMFRAQMEEVEARHVTNLCTLTQDHRHEQGIIQGIREMIRLPELLIARSRGN